MTVPVRTRSQASTAHRTVTAPDAVVTHRLHAHYGATRVLTDLSLSLPSGSITAVLGPNGAGKSTLFAILTTLKRPSAGTATVLGYDVRENARAVRQTLGVVFQEPTLDRDLSVQRNLMMHATLYGMAKETARTRISALLDSFELGDRSRDRVSRLSGGLARRVELTRALLHHPKLLILDEPSVGLDPRSRHQLWHDIHQMQQETGVTVLFSTHYMDETEHADHIVMMNDGQCVDQGSPARLKDRLGGAYVVIASPDPDGAAAILRGKGYHVTLLPGEIRVTTRDPNREAPTILKALTLGTAEHPHPVTVISLTITTPTMDDVFLGITNRKES